MKKILILSCLFLFFVSSCSNQEEVIVGDGLDYDNMSEEDLRKCAEANGAITWNQFIELMGKTGSARWPRYPAAQDSPSAG